MCGYTSSIYVLPPGGVSMIKFGQLNRSEFPGHLCTNFIFLFLQQLKISQVYYFGNKPDFPSVLTIHILGFNMPVITELWTLLFLIFFSPISNLVSFYFSVAQTFYAFQICNFQFFIFSALNQTEYLLIGFQSSTSILIFTKPNLERHKARQEDRKI